MSAQPDLSAHPRLAPWPAPANDPGRRRPDAPQAFLDTAASIGGKLCRDALWADGRCAWFGEWVGNVGGQVRDCHLVFGPDLYVGSTGVGLFLAHLAARTGERIFRRTALAALWRSLETADSVPPNLRLSLFNGWTGIALGGLSAAKALGEDALREPSLALLDGVESLGRDEWDVLTGAAGAIPALLRIHDTHGGPANLVEKAADVGDHLLRTAAKSDEGLSWGTFPTGVNRERNETSRAFGNLTGFSHGAGGVGWAFTELYAATGEKRFREAAEEAFRYERHWYSEEHENWLDLRDPAELGTPEATEPSRMRGWCHGSTGIALTRIRAWEVLGEEVYREEAETAVATSRSALEPGPELSQGNYCLCHGRGGNCEPLLYGAAAFDRPEWRKAAEEVGWQGVEEFEAMKLPWPCGTRRNAEIPALFVGLSGIGYFYLRLADPEATPSVLIFTPPRES